MNIFLGIAIYVIVWWLSFFVMLPMGAQSHHEADEETVPGTERGPRGSITSATRRSMRRGSRPSSGWALPGAFRSTFLAYARAVRPRCGRPGAVYPDARAEPSHMHALKVTRAEDFPGMQVVRPWSVKRIWRSCRQRAGA